MEAIKLDKVQAATANEVCLSFDLDEEVTLLLQEDQTPAQFLQTLIDHAYLADAARFLAFALPKREAVWLACLAAHSVVDESTSEAEMKALTLTEQWVYKPTEECRRTLMDIAETAGLDTPAGFAAASAYWSGENIAPADLHPVPPPRRHYRQDGLGGHGAGGLSQGARTGERQIPHLHQPSDRYCQWRWRKGLLIRLSAPNKTFDPGTFIRRFFCQKSQSPGGPAKKKISIPVNSERPLLAPGKTQ
ncbi:DUF6931 family protein [endosymbiont of Ridgeia piscesae]|jgi:hypothetical protein|uniref:Uncharacterized protein n=1 Tax=endosymbiont of Ridgeia piscesae TaxID=54398 RepID=A0A0T5Z0V0_9GAMM|nr:hypothetical protein [endosymbiont of Ridgeia piscesae]KRT56432.1 hypothetical protein Ga0074115_1468 [endosymbiont of Ridgeia piscesae]KRT60156.1 hypothetical protein Ga0076813_16803 [endosymbiont of Ridgeia piscesae]